MVSVRKYKHAFYSTEDLKRALKVSRDLLSYARRVLGVTRFYYTAEEARKVAFICTIPNFTKLPWDDPESGWEEVSTTKVFSIEEFAQEIGVSNDTAYKILNRHNLGRVLGRKRIIVQQDIDIYRDLKAGKLEPHEHPRYEIAMTSFERLSKNLAIVKRFSYDYARRYGMPETKKIKGEKIVVSAAIPEEVVKWLNDCVEREPWLTRSALISKLLSEAYERSQV